MSVPELESSDPVLRQETCSASTIRRVAAMLDLDQAEYLAGTPLPRGWQFVMLGADTRRSDLRRDGFPGLGVPMPDLGLPRLMLGGRSVSFAGDIPIGASVTRSSAVRSVVHKVNDSGPMAIVTLAHELRIVDQPAPALVETQTYLLLSSAKPRADDLPRRAADPISAEHVSTVTPDDTLLFQYSALGFNSHRIHIDRDYARNEEGFPDLVVNGGLITLLLSEFLRRDLNVVPSAFKVRHMAPLFSNRPVTLAADRIGERWRLRAFDDRNRLAAEMEVDIQ
jgi:3-methylfumaryl-CoA hydratase